MPGRLDTLTGMRFVAALPIVFLHRIEFFRLDLIARSFRLRLHRRELLLRALGLRSHLVHGRDSGAPLLVAAIRANLAGTGAGGGPGLRISDARPPTGLARPRRRLPAGPVMVAQLRRLLRRQRGELVALV